MNNTCPNPSCGAVYAVTAKDVGRQIKCKKCGIALRVDDSGLVEDDAAEAGVDEGAEESAGPKKQKKRGFSGGNPLAKLGPFVEKVGGVPTVLFGLGVFLTIWFFFNSVTSAPNGAADTRAKAATLQVKLEHDQELRKAEGDPPEQPEDGSDAKAFETYTNAKKEYEKNLAKERKKIEKKFRKPMADANDKYTETQISSARGQVFDQNGLMFGFLFLSFGCIAFVRSDANLVLRIVAGTILTLLFLVIFAKFSGCGAR
jgi:hypothetical protein